MIGEQLSLSKQDFILFLDMLSIAWAQSLA